MRGDFGFCLRAVYKMGRLLEPKASVSPLWKRGIWEELRDFWYGIVEVDVFAFGGEGLIAVCNNVIEEYWIISEGIQTHYNHWFRSITILLLY